MWVHLVSILGLTALCAAWVLFQLWLKRHDPLQGDFEKRCKGGCSGCSCEAGESADIS